MNVERQDVPCKERSIYFSGSIRGGREDQGMYAQIIGMLGTYGRVLTEHVGEPSLTMTGESDADDGYIFGRDKQCIHECTAVVAEVTNPSLGVGMELGYADLWNKPTLCLYRPQSERRLSAMVGGCPTFSVQQYGDISEVPLLLYAFFRGIHLRNIDEGLRRIDCATEKMEGHLQDMERHILNIQRFLDGQS